MNLPAEFIDKINRVFGKKGYDWLPGLPRIVAQCRQKWGLINCVISPLVSLNYIEFATTHKNEAVVLKVGVPHPELFTEMEALRLFKKTKAVRLLDVDYELGAMLMQRVFPGTMLWQLGNNKQETETAAEVMSQLAVQVPAGHNLPLFSHWVERAFRLTRTEWDPDELMPREIIAKAEEAFKEIEKNKTGDVILHGDLHHENILLDNESGWIVIDPKGVIGAPCLETGRFLQNQLPGSLPLRRREKILDERLHIFSRNLGYSLETIASAGLVDIVLSHCWSLEDSEIDPDWHNELELIPFLCRIMHLS